MGMSAGQARLLSITAKLTDNELRSQILTNSHECLKHAKIGLYQL